MCTYTGDLVLNNLCQKRTSATVQNRLSVAPDVLIVHVWR